MMVMQTKQEGSPESAGRKTNEFLLHAEEDKGARIGINKVVIVAPNTYVSSQALEEATGQEPGKISKGLGISKARLPTYSQGNVTLAAQAIYDFVKNVSSDREDEAKLFSEPIEAIYYATESNDDFSRPEGILALDIAGSRLLMEDNAKYRPYVDMLRHIKMPQVTFACAGAGLSLSSVLDSIHAAYTFDRSVSALIISTDTAVYDSLRAPKAEATQGSAATLAWITKDPKLLSVEYSKGYGSFTAQFPDFTKFGNHNPKVYGVFSEIMYVYSVAEAFEDLEARYTGSGGPLAIDAFVGHVPFPKQAIYFAGFLFEHVLKNYDKKKFEELQARPELGPSPIDGEKFTELMRGKLSAFRGRSSEIVEYIANDPEITAYWKWLKILRAQPEFDGFTKSLNIENALVLPAQVGNSYTGSTQIALASELLHGTGTRFAIAYYGSGLTSATFFASRSAKSRKEIEDNIIVSFGNDDMPLDVAQYREVHGNLLKGDAKRMMRVKTANLINKDRKLLRLERGSPMPLGFYIRRRNDDGTWEAEYSDGQTMTEIMPRY